MKKSIFVQKLDYAVIERAIAQAERQTSGEIRVVIAQGEPIDAVVAAKEQFLALGMDKTRDRNGVLLFVAPLSQTYAVIGDEGIHHTCGDAFWAAMAEVMGNHFKTGAYTEGLCEGITRAGELLRDHFPRRPDDSDELSNRVEII